MELQSVGMMRRRFVWYHSASTRPNASLAYSLAAVLFCWILLWLLWRKEIFIKV